MSNALTMTGRSLRLSARSPEALLTALLLLSYMLNPRDVAASGGREPLERSAAVRSFNPT